MILTFTSQINKLPSTTEPRNAIARSHKTQFTFIRFIFEALHLHLQKFCKETRSFLIPEKIVLQWHLEKCTVR